MAQIKMKRGSSSNFSNQSEIIDGNLYFSYDDSSEASGGSILLDVDLGTETAPNLQRYILGSTRGLNWDIIDVDSDDITLRVKNLWLDSNNQEHIEYRYLTLDFLPLSGGIMTGNINLNPDYTDSENRFRIGVNGQAYLSGVNFPVSIDTDEGTLYSETQVFGSETQPIYWHNGAPKATIYSLNATVNPGIEGQLSVYGTNGTSLENYTITTGSKTKPIYFNNGLPTEIDYELNATVNSGTAGLLTAYNSTGTSIGGYSNTVGSSIKPIYFNTGVPTEISLNTNRLIYWGANGLTAGTHYIDGEYVSINSLTKVNNYNLYINGNVGLQGLYFEIMSNSNSEDLYFTGEIGNSFTPIYWKNGVPTPVDSIADTLKIEKNSTIDGIDTDIVYYTDFNGSNHYLQSGNTNEEISQLLDINVARSMYAMAAGYLAGYEGTIGDVQHPIYWELGHPVIINIFEHMYYNSDAKSYSFGNVDSTYTNMRYAFANGSKNVFGDAADSTELYGFAFGYGNMVRGSSAGAFGQGNTVLTSYSYALGYQNTTSGDHSFSEGILSQANGDCSIAMGYSAIANGDYQMVIGRYNIADESSLFIVGNGTSSSHTNNALTVSQTGVLTTTEVVADTIDINTHSQFKTYNETETACFWIG